MISEQDVAFYNENGYLVVRDVLSGSEVEELRRATDEFVEKARAVSAHDEIYDLEDSHSAAEPRVDLLDLERDRRGDQDREHRGARPGPCMSRPDQDGPDPVDVGEGEETHGCK